MNDEQRPLTTKQLKRRYALLRKLREMPRSLRRWARTQPGGAEWLERKRRARRGL